MMNKMNLLVCFFVLITIGGCNSFPVKKKDIGPNRVMLEEAIAKYKKSEKVDGFKLLLKNDTYVYEQKNPEVVKYFNSLVERLLKSSGFKKKVNVYFIPGNGFSLFSYGNDAIVIKGGTLQNIRNPELVGTLSHEISHILLNHSIEESNYKSALIYITNLMIFYAQRNNDADLRNKVALAKEVISTSLLTPRSREQEFEADLLATELLNNAGYNPKYMLAALKKVGLSEKNLDESINLLEQVNIKKLESKGLENKLNDKVLLQEMFSALIKVLKKMQKDKHPPVSKRILLVKKHIKFLKSVKSSLLHNRRNPRLHNMLTGRVSLPYQYACYNVVHDFYYYKNKKINDHVIKCVNFLEKKSRLDSVGLSILADYFYYTKNHKKAGDYYLMSVHEHYSPFHTWDFSVRYLFEHHNYKGALSLIKRYEGFFNDDESFIPLKIAIYKKLKRPDLEILPLQLKCTAYSYKKTLLLENIYFGKECKLASKGLIIPAERRLQYSF